MNDNKNTSENHLQDASRIGRTSGSKAPEFQELYDYEVSPKNITNVSFPYQALVHKAYVVMLAEQHILTHEEAAKILKGLLKTDQLAQNNPALQVYLPYESQLIKEIGSLGGKMHIGRSRNDLDNTVNRMYLRDQLLDILSSTGKLRETLQLKAQENLQTVMPIYTHRKEAQPSTLAHYLTAVDESLGKSMQRFIELYARIDQSPLGSGASGGTSWNLNRERVGSLLGFGGMVTNTIEGAAGWDHITEFASDNAIYMSTLSRLASELQLLSTDEYQSVELDNSFAGISSMMPQKKNPDALERTRKSAALVAGELMGVLTSVNAIEYQHSGVRLLFDPRAIDAVLASTHTMTGVVRTLNINHDQMLKYARENFTTMTDLADLLVRKGEIDFREAHEIVATVVNQALDEHKTADKITLSMVQNAARKHLGHRLEIIEKDFRNALDPRQSVELKKGTGMPAAESSLKMIKAGQEDLALKLAWLAKQQKHLQQSASELMTLVKTY